MISIACKLSYFLFVYTSVYMKGVSDNDQGQMMHDLR